MRSTDLHKLDQLRRVRASRLVALERDLQTKRTSLREIEVELEACQLELSRARRQRDAWESEWQSWLRTHGVLSRGEDFSRYHVALTAWERDLREQLAEIQVRLRVVADAVESARRALIAAQARLNALDRKIEGIRQSMRQSRSLRQQRESAEIAAIAARQVRTARSRDVVSDEA